MAKRPAIPLLVVVIITIASLGVIAYQPPSFGMDEDSFMPENDITEAASVISTAFSSSSSVMTTMDAKNTDDGNIFTKDAFLSILQYEQSLYAMTYTDINGDTQPYSGATTGFSVMSPVTAISGGIAANMGQPATYAGMIAAINMLPSDAALQAAVVAAFETKDPQIEAMRSLFTTDLALDDTAKTAYAKGCIVMTLVLNDTVDEMADGVIGFEKDVGNAADLFEDTPAYLTGLSIGVVNLNTMMNEIGDMAMDDLSMLIPIALILILVILLLMYRDLVDMLIGMLGLVIAIIWTFGVSTVFGVEMTVIAIAVPILILGLGIDYGLHLVFRYREERQGGFGSAEASGRTVNSVGEALVLATVTTVIAFLSYLTSSMSALADFGLMCAIGIICAFVVMLLLIPAMQSIRDRNADKKGKELSDLRRYRKSESEHGDIIGKIAGIGGRMAAKKPWAVLGVAAVVVLGFGVSATNLSYEFDMYSFIPEGTDASDTLHYMNDNYETTTDTASVVIYADAWDITTMHAVEDAVLKLETGDVYGLSYIDGNGLDDPSYINKALWDLALMVTATMPASSYLTAYNKVFDIANGQLLTDDPNLVSDLKDEYGALITMVPQYSQGVDAVAGTYDGEAVTQILLNITPEAAEDSDKTMSMKEAIDKTIGDTFSDVDIKAVVSGSAIAMAVNLEEMNSSQMSSLILTLVLVLIILTIVMYYTDRSWWLGVMSTIPTLVSVAMVWGTMALLNIPLNVLTLTIASLTVGMGVTYGIHISHRFVTDLRAGSSSEDSIRAATRETGKGVFGAALTTAAGFGVIGFSMMVPMQQFGLITAMAIAFGYIGATFLLPSLLVIWGRYVEKKMSAGEPPETSEA